MSVAASPRCSSNTRSAVAPSFDCRVRLEEVGSAVARYGSVAGDAAESPRSAGYRIRHSAFGFAIARIAQCIRQIGRSVRRKEGRAKVTGQALYVDDVAPAGTLHGVTVRSQVPRGRITAIHFDPAINWNEFVVVTAKDIPGVNRVKLIADDQPYLASDVINHAEEPVVLIAHADRARADDARRRVTDRGRAAAGRAHDRRGALGPRDHLGHRQRLQALRRRERGRGGGVRAGAARRGRRVRDRGAGAALHRAERHDRHRRSPRRDRVGVDAVPVLRSQCAGGALRDAARTCPRRADGDGRGIRRQGRISVGHCRPCRAARVESRTPGQADLRPRRGHGCDHQAASRAYANTGPP